MALNSFGVYPAILSRSSFYVASKEHGAFEVRNIQPPTELWSVLGFIRTL